MSLVILEKKNIPEHLGDLECLDTPTTVDAILRELEDAGEAGGMLSCISISIDPNWYITFLKHESFRL